jgi:hypothetical protein
MLLSADWHEKLSETLRQAFVDQWPVHYDGYDVPRLTTQETLGLHHMKSKVSFDPPWCNPLRQVLSVEPFLNEENADHMVTMAVNEMAIKLACMALKAQGCDIRWSLDERIENPRPITEDDRRRVLTDYCGKIDVGALTPWDCALTLTLTLYKINADMP